MAANAYQPERNRLTEQLKQLRAATGLSGGRFAQAAGWGDNAQPKVSKIERGQQLPTEEDLADWTRVADAPGQLDDLRVQLRRARAESSTLKDAYAAVGAAGFQTDIMAVEAGSTRIAEFQTAMMPGLVQTPEYARAFLHLPCGPGSYGQSDSEIEAMIAARLQRQQQALYTSGEGAKDVTVVLLEAATRTLSVPAEQMAGQLRWLRSLTGLTTMTLGIIPFSAPVPVWPLTGFRLYDEQVVVETLVSEQSLDAPETVERYGEFLGLLRGAAVTGEAAAALIDAAVAELPA